jgi:hypothetical protein
MGLPRQTINGILALLVLSIALALAGCDLTGTPDPPFPEAGGKLPGDKWEVYTVKSYRTIEPKYVYVPLTKRTEVWLEFRLVLENKSRVLLTLSCGQVGPPTNLQVACGQGVLLPNEKVWTRAGAGEDLWIYSKQQPENGQSATLWGIVSSEAK